MVYIGDDPTYRLHCTYEGKYKLMEDQVEVPGGNLSISRCLFSRQAYKHVYSHKHFHVCGQHWKEGGWYFPCRLDGPLYVYIEVTILWPNTQANLLLWESLRMHRSQARCLKLKGSIE